MGEFCSELHYMKWFRHPSASSMPIIHPVQKTYSPSHSTFQSSTDWKDQARNKILPLTFGMSSHLPSSKLKGGVGTVSGAEPMTGVCKTWGEMMGKDRKQSHLYIRCTSPTKVLVAVWQWKSTAEKREKEMSWNELSSHWQKQNLLFYLEFQPGALCAYS